MADFYNFFSRRIEKAKECVYITGEGVDSSAEGEEHVLQLVSAMRAVLSRGVPVVRVQTRPMATDFWVRQMRSLVGDYPELFDLYVVLDPTSLQPVNLCAIDVDNSSKCIAEMMLEMPRYIGSKRGDVAGTALFIEGHALLAQSVRDRILDLVADPAISRKLSSGQEVESFFRGEYYFAYGSNMDEQQMVARCPSAIKVAVVVLPDHKLVFDRSGTYRPGGVANVRPAPGERVYGVLWKVAEADLQLLDATEDPTAYRRELIHVYTLQGRKHSCHVYFATPNQEDKPDQTYLDVLIGAASRSGLPVEYVEHLRARRPTVGLPRLRRR